MVERFGPGDVAELVGPERTVSSGATANRRREFAAGRACARAAQRGLGVAPTPIGVGAHGEPIWPTDLRGSITHCAGYAAAAVARSVRIAALGIDAEPATPLPADVAELVLTPAERTQTAAGDLSTLLIFSAKESVFKAHTSAGGTWLDPLDTVIDLHPDGRFTAPVPTWPGPQDLAPLHGRWSLTTTLARTALALPAQP